MIIKTTDPYYYKDVRLNFLLPFLILTVTIAVYTEVLYLNFALPPHD